MDAMSRHGTELVVLVRVSVGWTSDRRSGVDERFATCDPARLARRAFEPVDDRVLELGFVDLDAE